MVKRAVVIVASVLVFLLASLSVYVQSFPPLVIRQLEHVIQGNPPKVGVVLMRTGAIGPLVVRDVYVRGVRPPTTVTVMRTSPLFSLEAASREPGRNIGALTEWSVPRQENGEGIVLDWDSGPPLPEPPCIIVEYRYFGWPLRIVTTNLLKEDQGQCRR